MTKYRLIWIWTSRIWPLRSRRQPNRKSRIMCWKNTASRFQLYIFHKSNGSAVSSSVRIIITLAKRIRTSRNVRKIRKMLSVLLLNISQWSDHWLIQEIADRLYWMNWLIPKATPTEFDNEFRRCNRFLVEYFGRSQYLWFSGFSPLRIQAFCLCRRWWCGHSRWRLRRR